MFCVNSPVNQVAYMYMYMYPPLLSSPQGKITYSNGDLFEGSFVNGQIEGEGSLRCRNKLEYKGAWKHSQVDLLFFSN